LFLSLALTVGSAGLAYAFIPLTWPWLPAWIAYAIVAGTAGINPVGGRVRVDAKGLGLPFAQPFIDDRVNLALTSGDLAAKGELAFELPPGGGPRVLWTGDVNITDFASIDKPTASDLLKWKSLYLTRVRFQLEPLEASVDEIALSDFFSRLILNADGTFNVQNLLSRPGATGAEGTVRADGTRAGPAPKPAAPQPAESVVAAEAPASGPWPELIIVQTRIRSIYHPLQGEFDVRILFVYN
jgi:hypothetical protein